MSLSAMQSAAAKLIREPERYQGERLDEFLRRFKFSPREELQLRKAAVDRFVTKYAYSMRGVRWETIAKQIKLSKSYISAEKLLFIFTEFFEPKTVNAHMWDLPRFYFDFVLTDKDARRTLGESAPPFIFDMMKFERAQWRVWSKVRERRAIPDRSDLLCVAFEFVDLEYDILDLINRLTGDESLGKAPEPVARKVKILLLPQNTTKDCRYFEVNEDLQQFLERQLVGGESQADPLPHYYDDLVNIGLCKNRGER